MFCTAKQIINKIKRQPKERENIFADISDKGLISKVYKELIKLVFFSKSLQLMSEDAILPNVFFFRLCLPFFLLECSTLTTYFLYPP